jgi:DNA-binding protein
MAEKELETSAKKEVSAEKVVKEKKIADENVVFIGKKPAMTYVLAAVTQFSDGQKMVHLKARGKAISRAVDVAEITRNRFVEDAKIKNIDISTEEINTETGEKINVSAINITLAR